MRTFRSIAIVALLLFAGFAVAPTMAMADDNGDEEIDVLIITDTISGKVSLITLATLED